MEDRTVSLWINQSEKKSRTVSLWINQSENVPCQRVRKRDKPVNKRTEEEPCEEPLKKAFSEKENFTSRTKLCCFKELCILFGGLVSRWYRSKY